MSVPKSKQEQGEMRVVTAANKLASHTMNKCVNEKNFPKRFRWCCTAKIVDAATDICLNITLANSVFVKTQADYELRRAYQSAALAETYALLTLMQIAYTDDKHFKIDGIDYWTSLVNEVQDLLRAWRKSDDERYKKSIKSDNN